MEFKYTVYDEKETIEMEYSPCTYEQILLLTTGQIAYRL